MTTQTKVLQGHTTTIDRDINAWANQNGVAIRNVTLSEMGKFGKAGWVTATVIYVAANDNPLVSGQTEKRQAVRTREQAQSVAWANLPAPMRGVLIAALCAALGYLLWIAARILLG